MINLEGGLVIYCVIQKSYKINRLQTTANNVVKVTSRDLSHELSEPSHLPSEEEKLKFYMTSYSFCLCNSACSLQSLDDIGHVVSESGDSQY